MSSGAAQGRAGRSGSVDDQDRVHFDLRGIEGKKGLEGTYNALLEGKPGYRLVQIDVAGFHYRDLQTKPPKNGIITPIE